MGRSGDKLSVGTTLTNDGTTTIGNGATVYALGAASNTGSSASLFLQGGSLTALSFSNTELVKGFGTINPAISNGNLVEANGGTLVADGGVQGTAGTVQIDSGATLDLSNSPTASSAAILTQNGSLKLGSQNITVSQDYTNANFGAGNSFNRRADVTGAGQILASGNVAQALGGNVTGGTTATPTMTFGNVHVGSSTNSRLYDRKYWNLRSQSAWRDPDQRQRRQSHLRRAFWRGRDRLELGPGPNLERDVRPRRDLRADQRRRAERPGGPYRQQF